MTEEQSRDEMEKVSNRSDDDVEAHRWHQGPAEKVSNASEDDDVEAHRWHQGPAEKVSNEPEASKF
jgi:hypothetical protein